MNLKPDQRLSIGHVITMILVALCSVMWLGMLTHTEVMAASNNKVVTEDNALKKGKSSSIAGAIEVQYTAMDAAQETKGVSIVKKTKRNTHDTQGTKGTRTRRKPSLNRTGYVSANSGLRIRENANPNSEIVGVLGFATKVKYGVHTNNKWYIVKMDNNEYGYVCAKYISKKYIKPVRRYSVSGSSRKPYMSWRSITSTGSKQYRLQSQYGETSSNGVRVASGRYCIAIGQSYNADVGTLVDVTLANGETLPCVVGDLKKYQDTQGGQGFYGISNEPVEFIVETSQLDQQGRRMGSLECYWSEKVVNMEVYDTNILQQ